MKITNFTIKPCFEADFDSSLHFFSKLTPPGPLNTELLNKVTPLVSLGGQLIKNLANTRHFMEEISESRPKITQISKISIKIQLPQNEF